MIRSLIAVTPFRRTRDCCDLWFSVGPAYVGDMLVGVDIRIGDRGLMVDMPRRVDMALAVQECECEEAEHED